MIDEEREEMELNTWYPVNGAPMCTWFLNGHLAGCGVADWKILRHGRLYYYCERHREKADTKWAKWKPNPYDEMFNRFFESLDRKPPGHIFNEFIERLDRKPPAPPPPMQVTVFFTTEDKALVESLHVANQEHEIVTIRAGGSEYFVELGAMSVQGGE